ncbi:von willebrand factor type A (vWA) domain was originally protein (macronuclear) [Tetrahymena thermophila SB210]|uniref:von willebrand factor type A (VWA) domain was originally protein n=1 Tax=Tetrahymena thermophila (strain SB210) TaxID=312017 RepID=Q22SJ5_TETTS|nr:von willebrand factor type A (vWA) domain was originally protein [Tetrahymena thermophila SB210]EAR87777.1 von willebrand factor type A (vWA) domain was originally protein [Tetrahymena thermophila SB210]|eukprot:XP_001008022.1 von willebrand factor type A (vWA) domain was originally protein [Tetrahymena thermophila SB210]
MDKDNINIINSITKPQKKLSVSNKTEAKKISQPSTLAKKTTSNTSKNLSNQVKTSPEVQQLISQVIKQASLKPKSVAVQKQSLAQNPIKAKATQLKSAVSKQLTSFQKSDISIQKEEKIQKLDTKTMLREQEIKPDLQQMIKDAKKPSYDLEKGLTFEIKTLNKHFQFNNEQDCNIPIMVSVKTQDSTNDILEEQKEQVKQAEQSRPSIDLVCVIDNSGSMQGEKIQNVKTTLLQLLDMLNSNDRLSLILFNSYPTLLCNLRKVDDKNTPNIQKIINSITAEEYTDINSGMLMAFNILQKRQFFNPVSSIFLLSDGQDNGADEKIKKYINSNQSLKNECFSIHSFGFGSDHDGPLMNRICQLKDGNFYYVEKINQVDEFFVDALGGLFSVVAQEILIEINLNRQDKNFQKYFSNCKVSKTYGDMWKCIKQDEIYQIKINQLFSGVSKDFIMEIVVPKQEVKMLEDFERNLEIVKGQLTAIPVDIQYTTKIVKDSNLILTLFLQNETVPVDSEINDAVEFNYLRVQAAEAMEVAISYSEKQQYEQSQVVLKSILSKIENSHPKNKQKILILKKDLLDCQESAQPRVYENVGKYKMLSKKVANSKQASQAVEECDMYQNNIQKVMVMCIKKKKM